MASTELEMYYHTSSDFKSCKAECRALAALVKPKAKGKAKAKAKAAS